MYIGDNDDEIGYSARLESPEFPLKKDLACKLNMTFTYGADDPYCLIFEPDKTVNSSVRPIRVKWEKTVEEEITNAPVPDYPTPMTWEELRFWKDAQGNEVDLLSWLIHRLSKTQKYSKLHQLTEQEREEKIFYDISRKSYLNRVNIIWANGNCLENSSNNRDVNMIRSKIQFLLSLINISPRIKTSIFQILAYMHKDAPEECIQWIIDQVETRKIVYPQAVGFSLGDVTENWQKYILQQLVMRPNKDALRVFSYAIWREEHFVDQFNYSDCQYILNCLKSILKNTNPFSNDNKHDKKAVRNWARTTTEPLELLLGMLRTRNSSNEEIKRLLQPHQTITKELTKQVERVTRIVAESNVWLPSRVQLVNLPQKPEGDHTPDLLYALLLFLRGNSLANTIRITGVSDTDSDDE